MAEIKFVINDPKTGKSYQKALDDESLVGKKIGDTVSGDVLGLEGYTFSIKGGSDFAGFPLRKDIEGIIRKKVLMQRGVGNRSGAKGEKRRKSVSGNTITPKTVQVNLMVTTYGAQQLDNVFGKKEETQAAQ